MPNTPLNILRLNASARCDGSVSRQLTDRYIDSLAAQHAVQVTIRDLTDTLPFIDGHWISANFTPDADRTDTQRQTLALSDRLIQEIEAADMLVIGTPIYNFSVPASLKAWIDLIARAGKTFRYTENGPVGLLQGKRAVILAASGGTKVGSDIDFAVPYLTHVMGFIGIDDVTTIAADQLMMGGDDKIKATEAIIADQSRKIAA